MSQIGGLLFPAPLWLGWLQRIVMASFWWADVRFGHDHVKPDFQRLLVEGFGPKQHLAGLIVTRQHYLATTQNISARLGRSRMNANDFVTTREIDAVRAAMIDLKDSFKIRNERMQTQA